MDDIGLVTADNPGPFTLRGTNTWLVGRNPCFVVDPGPLAEAHLQRILSDAHGRGGIGGIALTHDHLDHAEAVAELRRRAGGVAVAAARSEGADVRLE
ncbi:MAG: MBL fold metallo-hydrolase, partial [Solirubrobacteraceae bacterium]